MHKFLRNVFNGTLLSILVFLSISFITVLTHINPIHYYSSLENYKLEIGFPFIYYEQFWLAGSRIPNSIWMIDNLIYNCVLTWVVVTGIYLLTKRIRIPATKSHNLT